MGRKRGGACARRRILLLVLAFVATFALTLAYFDRREGTYIEEEVS